MIKKTITMLAAMACFAALQASAITINFSEVSGTVIRFTGSGNTFEVVNLANPAGNEIQVTSVLDGVGDSVNDMGRIDGTFTIGAITTAGPLQSASVSGSGTLALSDGHGNTLSGTISWDSISTIGSGGIINVAGVFNYTAITYTPVQVESDLAELAAAGSGIATLSFQFATSRNLTALTTDGAVNDTSFSGSITVPVSVPDGGATVMFLGLALGALGMARRFRM